MTTIIFGIKEYKEIANYKFLSTHEMAPNVNQGEMLVDKFILEVILGSSKLLTVQFPFTAFGVISIGIEFIGKCLDEEVEFHEFKRGLPKKHFDMTINTLMIKYKPLNDKYDFQDKLRNGFLHSFCPKRPLWLRDANSATEPHLTEKDGVVHLIIEELYKDFEVAANRIVADIASKKFNNPKMYRPYLQTIL